MCYKTFRLISKFTVEKQEFSRLLSLIEKSVIHYEPQE